ncbi:hypothetical protein [Bradyrhizobium sp. USDA 4451]
MPLIGAKMPHFRMPARRSQICAPVVAGYFSIHAVICNPEASRPRTAKRRLLLRLPSRAATGRTSVSTDCGLAVHAPSSSGLTSPPAEPADLDREFAVPGRALAMRILLCEVEQRQYHQALSVFCFASES